MTDIITEKICIVTGGTSGIGLAVSEALLRRGAVVYMADISGENIAAAQEKLKVSQRPVCPR
ncbi:MAG TPA: SDR family NAD(P)-dependent oxidoreductase [Methanocorpusculum sp.]|nr:SDR family NAD(P)-dependent oxidoreductase [Methanocorpusculum sp.]